MRQELEGARLSSQEIVENYLDRIDNINPELNAYVDVYKEDALRQSEESDQRRKEGNLLSAWDGIPIAIKDNIAVKGKILSCSSKILSNFQAPYQAFVTQKILDNGLIPLGKTNLDEFAMGSSTENSAFMTTRNPWNREHVPGGSSGGSAACVAAEMAPWSLGSDTGGSIRLPASFCGVVGLKPTYGKVSRYGLVAYGSSLDQIGPMAKSVADSAILLNIISGYDPKDSTSVASSAVSEQFDPSSIEKEISEMKIGIPAEYFSEDLHPDVQRILQEQMEKLKEAGAKLVDISLPHTDYAVPVYYLIATAEASSNLARYDGVRYGLRNKDAKNIKEVYAKSRHFGFGKEVKRRILLGTYVLSAGYYDAYYRKASKVRTLIRNDFKEVFGKVDAVLSPVATSPAFRIGERIENPIEMYLSDLLTISANLAGLPALSVNGGFSEAGLPVGVQIMGDHFMEEKILRLGRFLEEHSEKRDYPLD